MKSITRKFAIIGLTLLYFLVGVGAQQINPGKDIKWPMGCTVYSPVVNACILPVQYNSSTAVYYLASSSILMDDSHSLSSAVTPGVWSCNGALCTVNTTTAHGYQTGDWVDVSGMTTWESSRLSRSYVDEFPITVTSTTQFTFASTSTNSGSGGSLYLATYWGAYEAANQPFIKGHGTFTFFFSFASDLSSNFSTQVNCAAGTPSYIIIQSGLNDIVGGASVSTMEGYYMSIWQQAHAAGCIVVQTTLLNTQLGDGDSDSYWQEVAQLNQWMAGQGITNANHSTGVYWDRFIDFASYGGTSGRVGTDASGSAIFGQRLNEAFANQGSSMNVAPLFQSWTNNTKAFTIPGSLAMLDNYNPVVYFNTLGWYSYNTPRIESHSPNTIYNSSLGISNFFDVGTATNFTGCTLMGNTYSTLGDAGYGIFRICYTQVSYNSPLNYYSIGSTSHPNSFKIFSSGAFQFPNLLASSGTVPLMVDNAGNVSVGAENVATLTSGTVTVTTTSACTPAAGCVYKLTNCGVNGSSGIGTPSIGTVVVGTSFIINSLGPTASVLTTDTSIICWQIN